MGHLVTNVEAVIGELAGGSHGVVTRTQLLAAGITRKEIVSRVRRGTLIREHPGVYRVGHRAPSVEARYMAAVRAGGTGTALAGPAAANLLKLIKGRAPAPEVIARGKRRIEGVKARRSQVLQRGDVRVWRGIPVTNVPWTVVDLAAVLSEEDLARAFHEANVRYRTTPAQVEAVLARRPRVPGAAKLRRVLRGDVDVILSELERRFRRLLRKEGLELPVMNRPAGAHYVDCRWPGRKLTVELDSYRYHNSRHAWEQDRRREREARARGDDFRRYTWHDVVEEPRPTLAELRPLLS